MKVRHITTLDNGLVVDADISRDDKLCVLKRKGDHTSLLVEDEVWRVFDIVGTPWLRNCRWAPDRQIAIWTTASPPTLGEGSKLCSKYSLRTFRIGEPDQLFCGEKVAFVTFDEEQYFGSKEDDLESNLIACFDYDGNLIFGLCDILKQWPANISHPTEINSAYVTHNDNLIVNFYNCSGLWIMDPYAKYLRLIPGSESFTNVSAITQSNRVLILLYVQDIRFHIVHFDIVASKVVFEIAYSYDELFSIDKNFFDKTIFTARGCVNGRFVAIGGATAVILTM